MELRASGSSGTDPGWSQEIGGVAQLAKKTVRAIGHELRQMAAESELRSDGWPALRQRADALSRWQLRSEAAASITAMLHMAESDPRVSIATGQFDRDPWLLNLSNGTVELQSFRFREHRSEELLTKLAGTKYSSGAKCPLWNKFLREVFVHNPELISFVQRSIGYTLTGVTREECIFVLVGSGRNGKSTMIGVLNQLLGDYAGVAEIEAFLVSHVNSLREDIADMRGRRLVSAQEPSMRSAFAEATIKWISGGDKLRARRLYEHAQEFQPSHKLWLAMNCLPKISYSDKAAWSRLHVIPFQCLLRR